jgi:hypothetical protein
MKSMMELPIGKSEAMVEVWNKIDHIPATIKRGMMYKANIMSVDVLSLDNKKNNILVVHWRITTSGERPRKGKFPNTVVRLQLVKK